jgi:hypothetical protein
MPPRSTHFDADALEILQTAHDEACDWLRGTDGSAPDEDTRKVIALRIVDCAKSGEREPSRLKAYALAGFSLVGRSKNTVRTTLGVATIAADRKRTGA